MRLTFDLNWTGHFNTCEWPGSYRPSPVVCHQGKEEANEFEGHREKKKAIFWYHQPGPTYFQQTYYIYFAEYLSKISEITWSSAWNSTYLWIAIVFLKISIYMLQCKLITHEVVTFQQLMSKSGCPQWALVQISVFRGPWFPPGSSVSSF